MPQLSPLELFAVFAAQLPLLTREDLEHGARNMRGAPGWLRALDHAKLQAAILGLDLGDQDDVIASDPPL